MSTNNEEKEDIFAKSKSSNTELEIEEKEDPFTPTATSNPTSLKPVSYTNSDPFANVDDEEEIEIVVKPKTKAKPKPKSKPKEKKEDIAPITNDKTLSVPEAINEFYALKSKYETINFNKYIKPILKSTGSKREKKSDYSKLPKFPCINCKRNVNSIFKVSYDTNSNDGIRKYVAKCGDVQDPCPLNIEIHQSVTYNAKEKIDKYTKKIEDIKFDIIKQKNNALFFKNPESILQKFEELTNNLKEEAEFFGSIVEENLLKTENPARTKILNETLVEFNQGLLLPFKDMIQEFKRTNDEAIINNAIIFYKNEMLPKLKEIQELKYEINYIEYVEQDATYHLIQLKNSFDKGEFNFNNGTKVVNFVRGLKGKTTNSPDGSLSKTLKIKPSLIKSSDSSSNSKTRKNRSTESEEELDKEEDEEEKEDLEQENGYDF